MFIPFLFCEIVWEVLLLRSNRIVCFIHQILGFYSWIFSMTASILLDTVSYLFTVLLLGRDIVTKAILIKESI